MEHNNHLHVQGESIYQLVYFMRLETERMRTPDKGGREVVGSGEVKQVHG